LAVHDLGVFEGGQWYVLPSWRAIEPGGVATYTIHIGSGSSTLVRLTAANPSPSLSLQIVPKSVTPPGQAVLTVTDNEHGTPLPGKLYNIAITAVDSITRTTSVRLLVGGARVYLPVIE